MINNNNNNNERTKRKENMSREKGKDGEERQDKSIYEEE